MYNGLFVIQQHVIEWLDEFKTINEHIIKNIKVDLSKYGKMDLTGHNVEHFEPVPNIYYQDRQTYFNDVNKKFEQRVEMEFDTRPKWRLTDILKEPKNLLQILEIGIKNPVYSTCAMAELLNQIY